MHKHDPGVDLLMYRLSTKWLDREAFFFSFLKTNHSFMSETKYIYFFGVCSLRDIWFIKYIKKKSVKFEHVTRWHTEKQWQTDLAM